MTTSQGNPWTENVWTLSGDNQVEAHDNSEGSEDEDCDVIFDTMRTFCHSINEPQLVEKFLEHNVTLTKLLEFDEQDLKECGIDLVGDRKKILHEVAQAHSEKWTPASLRDLTAKSSLTSPGIYTALNDINKQFGYIGVTFKYLRHHIQKSPSILDLGKDHCSVSKISEEIEDLMKTTKSAYSQLQALNYQVCKHLDDPILKPANHIDSDYVFHAKLRKNLVPIVASSLVIAASVKIFLALNRTLNFIR